MNQASTPFLNTTNNALAQAVITDWVNFGRSQGLDEASRQLLEVWQRSHPYSYFDEIRANMREFIEWMISKQRTFPNPIDNLGYAYSNVIWLNETTRNLMIQEIIRSNTEPLHNDIKRLEAVINKAKEARRSRSAEWRQRQKDKENKLKEENLKLKNQIGLTKS